MTADDIKALVERLRGIAEYKASLFANRYQKQAQGPEIEAADALETLSLENLRLRVDAERYRWLRDLSEPGICAFYLSVGKAFEGVKFKRETVDEAIDAQITAGRAQTDKEGS